MKPIHKISAAIAAILAFFAISYVATKHSPQPVPDNGPLVNTPMASKTSCTSQNGLPDPVCTPGLVRTTDLAVICHQGTKQFRPPVSYTNNLKIQQIAAYGYSDTNPSDYEEDHLIPLEAGGDGYDPKNLWPEPLTGPNNAHQKDLIENLIHKRICDGTITAQEGQKEISTNWELIH